MKKNSLKYIIGGVLVVGVIVWIFGSISSDNMTYYYTPSEIPAKYASIGNQTVRIMGVVKTDSVKWVPKSTKLSFQLTDEQSYELNVEYTGAKPDMFREGQGVVVEGKLSDTQSLVANALLVKHNEDYSATDHKKQKEDYTKSLQQ